MSIQPADLTFTQPTPPLSMNKAKGAHYRVLKRSLDPWKRMAFAVGHNHRITTMRANRWTVWRPKPIVVTLVIQFSTNRVRDPHNYVGTVVKSVVDGLVEARVVPDDNPEWVTVMEPVLEVAPKHNGRGKPAPLTATIRIRPREMFTR